MAEYIEQYDDNWNALKYDSFDGLIADAEAWFLGSLGDLNIPVYAEHYDWDEGFDGPIPPRLEVGVLMPRHGNLAIWIAPASDDEAMQFRREIMMPFWAGRADRGFSRYNVREPLRA